MKLYNLINQIEIVNSSLKMEANKAINQLLTIRNWLIGYYIVNYEQNGEDRAKYGSKLLETISNSLNKKGLSHRNIKLFRQFYIIFPEIGQLITAESKSDTLPIMQSITAVFEKTSKGTGNESLAIGQLPTAQFKIKDRDADTNTPFSKEQIKFALIIVKALSFTHLTLLLPLNDDLKKAFYAIEAIKGTWSVKELKRQINTLLFERSGLSKNPQLLIKKINNIQQEKTEPKLVKDIYTFEFLGLPVADAVEESDLETALLEHFREFILELGNGFCLEARQKRILIGEEYYFIDLVFYHRLLKCHVLVEIKVDEFKHANAGQLNAYLNFYKKEVKQKDDNDPIGILLVANKNNALVEYATAGMDENLFVSKYMLQLPNKKQLEAFLKTELKELK